MFETLVEGMRLALISEVRFASVVLNLCVVLRLKVVEGLMVSLTTSLC